MPPVRFPSQSRDPTSHRDHVARSGTALAYKMAVMRAISECYDSDTRDTAARASLLLLSVA